MSVDVGFYVSIWNTKFPLEDTQNETTGQKRAFMEILLSYCIIFEGQNFLTGKSMPLPNKVAFEIQHCQMLYLRKNIR